MTDLSQAGRFRRRMCANPPTHDFPQYNYRGDWKPEQCPACEIKRLAFLHDLDHSLADQWQAKNEKLERQLAEAREAVRQLIQMVAWENADGGDVQDWAVKVGVLVAVGVTEPCNPDNCVCAEFGFPSICYRFSEAYRLATNPAKPPIQEEL